MRQGQGQQRGAARARTSERERAPWLMALMVAAGVIGLGISLVHAQPAVPEIVAPRSSSPTIPPSSNGGVVPPSRSENPLADSGSARPIPDGGVIAPPATGSTPVIRPPVAGAMPVLPPPGSAGGERAVVPK